MSLTAIIFLAAFCGALLAAFVKHPIYGLYAYIATFYLHPIDKWWGSSLPDLRWALLAAIITLVASLRLPTQPDQPSWTGNTAAKLLITLTLWLWLQNLWALSPNEHFEASILFTKYLILFYLIYLLVDSQEKVRDFLFAHVAGCLYLGWLVFQARDGGRLEGVGGPGINEANALGMHLSTGALSAAALLMRGSWRSRLFALLSLPIILNGIVQTESRGAFLGLAVGGLAMLYLSPGPLRKYWIIFGFLGVFGLLRVAPQNFWERMDTIFVSASTGDAVDRSSESRLQLVKAQWQMFIRYPAGSGHRGTAYLSPQYLSEEFLARSRPDSSDTAARSSHNTFMTALSEQGVPGVIIYLGLLLWIFRTCRNVKRRALESGTRDIQLYVVAIGGSLVSVTVAGLFTDYFKAEVFVWCIVVLVVLEKLVSGTKPAVELTPGTRAIKGHGTVF